MTQTQPTQLSLGALLRHHREQPIYMEPVRDKLTQKDLARMIGCDHTLISRIEREETTPKADTIERFIEVLALPADKAEEIRLAYRRVIGVPAEQPLQRREDWGTAPDVSVFYGRQTELADLERWVVSDRCRLVAVLGMGGMGKTTLVTKLAQWIKNEFAYVLWRSLLNAPPLADILSDALKFLSDQQMLDLPDDPGRQISQLITLLRERRCLLILDNAETILQPGGRAGHYRAGYDAYGQLLRQPGRTTKAASY